MSHLSESINYDWQTEILPAGTFVYNATDTTDDVVKIVDKSDNIIKTFNNMIELWREATGNFDNIKCCNKLCKRTDFKDIVGAHVVLEKENTELFPGDSVYIIPICRSCNNAFSPNTIILKHDVIAIKLFWLGK